MLISHFSKAPGAPGLGPGCVGALLAGTGWSRHRTKPLRCPNVILTL